MVDLSYLESFTKGNSVKMKRYINIYLSIAPQTFQDMERHQYFNTNSLWLNLPALQEVIVRHDGVIPLPIIVNRKTLDPTHKQSQPIIQLESAMGAAIEVFEGSQAIRIDRDRFCRGSWIGELRVRHYHDSCRYVLERISARSHHD